jgi:hypothetical protein
MICRRAHSPLSQMGGIICPSIYLVFVCLQTSYLACLALVPPNLSNLLLAVQNDALPTEKSSTGHGKELNSTGRAAQQYALAGLASLNKCASTTSTNTPSSIPSYPSLGWGVRCGRPSEPLDWTRLPVDNSVFRSSDSDSLACPEKRDR